MEKENDIVICPYDRNHIIHTSRIQRHLMKCSRNFPPGYKTSCPYNATHLLFPDEFPSHIEICQDRKYINPERFTFALKNHGSVKSCPPSEAESAIYDETWEQEQESETTTNDEGSVVSNAESIPPPIMPILPTPRAGFLRQPRSRSEAVMLETPADESIIDDDESVISAISGAGRGIKFAQRVQHLAMVGRRPPIHYDMTKTGISAISDVSDAESVISERGCGRGTIRMRYN